MCKPGPRAACSHFRPRWRYLAACWAAADVLAGWLAVAVGRRAGAVRALAAALALYAGAIHLYLSWPDYPWWYNLAVALPAAPAVLLGGRLGRRFLRVPAATGAH